MKLLCTHQPLQARPERRGAALLLSFLMLMVIIAIVYQLNRVTGTDQQVANKDMTLTAMDLAIGSALLEVQEQLREDAEMKLGAGGGEGEGEGMGAGMDDPAAAPGEGGESNPDAVDCQTDEWAQVAATNINELDLRILIQDEDSKYNILNMLVPDPEEAQDAYERVARILDSCREGTEVDIDGATADEMARVMRDHMLERDNSPLPRPAQLLNDDEEEAGRGLPLTLREFVVLEPFEEHHFRDYFDPEGTRVHSIGSFLTVFTAPATGSGQGGSAIAASGGDSVNLNTAPLAVLAGLFDSRDVDTRFWDEVLLYRNDEEEIPTDEEPPEEIFDEFGNIVIQKQFFDSLEELSEIPDWDSFEPELRAQLERLLRVDSDVFSVFITARKTTAAERRQRQDFESRLEQERYERSGVHLTHTVRAVYWRQERNDEVHIVPLVNWEVLDYAPLPVLDLPEDY